MGTQLKTELQSNMWSRVAALICLTASCHAGLLGAGSGEGSCAAPPFRVTAVKWAGGCPAYASCCTEFGYCRGQDEWLSGNFRDCNGISNGRPLEAGAIAAENAAAAAGDFSAANILVVPEGGNTYDLVGAAAPIAAAPIAVAAGVPAATPAIAAGFAAAPAVAASGLVAAGNGFAAIPAGGVTVNSLAAAPAGFVAAGNGIAAAPAGFVAAGNGIASLPAGALSINGAGVISAGNAYAAVPAGTVAINGAAGYYAANGAAVSGYDSNGNPIYASAVNSYLPPAY